MGVIVEKSTKSGRKAKGDGYLRRAEILQAAEELFLREGYQGATIRKIAQEVGLSSTALYMHFRDKNEILSEICDNAFRLLGEANVQIAALPLPPAERARRMLGAYIRFGLDNPNAYLVVFERTLELEPEKISALGEQVAAPFHAALAALAETTPLRCGVEEATQICWAACHGLVTLMIKNPAMEWTGPPEAVGRQMVDTLISGLRAE